MLPWFQRLTDNYGVDSCWGARGLQGAKKKKPPIRWPDGSYDDAVSTSMVSKATVSKAMDVTAMSSVATVFYSKKKAMVSATR